MAVQTFELSDILSITTGYLVSNSRMDGVYKILGFMTNDPYITTIGLAATQPAAAEELLRQHPQLSNVQTPERFTGIAHIAQWLAEQEALYGTELAVESFGEGFVREGDFSYLRRMNPNAEVIGVVLD